MQEEAVENHLLTAFSFTSRKELAVTRGEEGGANGEQGRRVVKEHVEGTHGQSQREAGSRMGSGDILGGRSGGMDTTVHEQQ